MSGIDRLRQRWSAVSPEARAIVLILLVFFLRLFWLSDMEFKGDEKYTANYLAMLDTHAFAPATEPTGHSGMTLSNGFYYFLDVFPVNYENPLHVSGMIAGLNAFAVAIGLWFLRKSKAGFLTFALIGTSVTLVQGSRKIWYPDLVPFWSNLGLAFFLISFEARVVWRRYALFAAAAFCFGVAGHMYMPGLMIGGCVSAAGLLYFALRKDGRALASWVGGLALAGITWVPYLLFMFSGSGTLVKSSGGFHLDAWLVEPILRHASTLPSAYPFYGLYLRNLQHWFQAQASGLFALYDLTAFWLMLTGAIGVVLYWASLLLLARNWKSLKSNPILCAFLAMLLLIPPALLLSHLGSYVHYWLGVMPFAFYLIAWAANLGEWPKVSLWLRRLAWTCCWLSVIGALSFALLVHEVRGLPGEYGPAYSSQKVSATFW